jgi:hypothetical protein
VPIYTVPADQPTVKVTLTRLALSPALQTAWNAVPLPANAQPAAGTDEHLVVWQPSTDRLWEFWALENGTGGWHAAWGGAMQNASSNPGAYGLEAWPGAQPGWGASATSLSIAGGLITLEDLELGQINHALAIAIPRPRAGVYASPARRTDGWSTEPLALPEGAHLRLDPNLDLAALHLPRLTLMMAQAAQRYGIVVRDYASNVAFYAQDPTPTGTNPYIGTHGYFEGKSPQQLLTPFPWSHLQLLKMELHSKNAPLESSLTQTVEPPANTKPPTITGQATVGQTLSASTGSWTGSPSLAYQWERCNSSGLSCETIAAAQSSGYAVLAADVGKTLAVTVTGSSSAGSAAAQSAPTAVVSAVPANSSPPAISGTAREGETLSASPGSWSGSYQWERCNSSGVGCEAIAGATSSTYAVLAADVGKTLAVTVTGSSSAGSASAQSAPTAVAVSAAGPVTPLLDDFARPNNSGPPGTNWTHMIVSSTSPTNDFFITNHQVTGRPNSNADYWNPQAYGPNSEVWVTVAVKPNVDQDPVVLGLRFQNPGAATASGYQAFYIFRTGRPDQYKITRRTNGTTSMVLTSSEGPTLKAGDRLLFRAIGTTLELWRENAGTWTRLLSATDTAYQGAGYLNMTARNGTVRLANFGGGTLP